MLGNELARGSVARASRNALLRARQFQEGGEEVKEREVELARLEDESNARQVALLRRDARELVMPISWRVNAELLLAVCSCSCVTLPNIKILSIPI